MSEVMPDLNGSPKQIAWATKIREGWLETIQEQASTMKQKDRVIKVAEVAISRIDQSKWFIDNKDGGWKIADSISMLISAVGDEDFDFILENTRSRTRLDIRKEDVICE